MIETSSSIKNLVAALLQVQGKLLGVARNSDNPFHKSKYANLEAVINAARGPLQDAGVVFTQHPGILVDGCLRITTQLTHVSGEWIRSTLSMPLAKSDPQATGSAITYGCRYSLMAVLGLPPVDDDGEAAMGRDTRSSAQAKRDGDFSQMVEEIRSITDVKKLERWGLQNVRRIDNLPSRKGPDGLSWQDHLRDEYQTHRESLLEKTDAV